MKRDIDVNYSKGIINASRDWWSNPATTNPRWDDFVVSMLNAFNAAQKGPETDPGEDVTNDIEVM